MARIPRKWIIEDKSYFHVTWKCHNNDHLLSEPAVKRQLYHLLLKYKQEHRIKIFGYCFMDNHPHILGFCESQEQFSQFFRVVNGCLARFLNKTLNRSGQVIMDRFRSPQIQNERHLIHCLHYVHLNPVRAGICPRAQDYQWSSCRFYTKKVNDQLLDPLPTATTTPVTRFEELLKTLEQAASKKAAPPHIRSHTFFIGSPPWIRKRRFDLYQKLMLSNTSNLKRETQQ